MRLQKILLKKKPIHIALVDNNNLPIDIESVVEVYNNPSFYETLPRSLLVDKSFKYESVKSEFGTSISASSDYLVIGNPSDRKYTPLSDQRRTFKSGAVFLYKMDQGSDIKFLEKLYGENNSEVYFNSRFGCDLSIIGNNFIVGGFADEYSEINLVQSGADKKLEIQDFEFGPKRFSDNTYVTTEVLITNYEYDLNTPIGDAVIKIDIGSLFIDKTKLSEIEIRADFIDTGRNTIRISDVRGEGLDNINGAYQLVNNPVNVRDGCEIQEIEPNVYMNDRGWSVYWDNVRESWVLTDTPNISYQYKETLAWTALLKT